MPEATLVREFDEQRLTAAAAVSVGDVWQMANGEAAYYLKVAGAASITAGASGDRVDFRTSGKVTMPLTSAITILDGGRCYWDYSANLVHYKKVNDRDFYIGRAVGDASGGVIVVDVNKDPHYDIDLLRDPVLSVPVGTQAVGGFGYPKMLGGAAQLDITSTSEAQKIDMLSVDGFAKAAKAIVEMVFRITNDGAGTVVDVSFGFANGTNATDADAITEHCFVHLDANNTNINLQSKDSGTTVTSTDTTLDYTEGSAVASRVEVWMDMRNPASVAIYVNGVRALPATTFNLNAVASTLFLLAHIEKTSAADVYAAVIDRFCARFMEQ